jgi:HEAT repeat protein
MSCAELIALMSRETDENRYRQLARMLLAKALQLKQEHDFDRLFVVLSSLAAQGSDPARSAGNRGQALWVLQQLALGEMAGHLLDHLEDAEFTQQETVYQILQGVGAEVVDAVIERLIAIGLKAPRKALTTALLRIGPAAEPALLGLLKDARWQVVTAAIAILAELGSRDATKGLMVTAYHSDNRVRMESIRALAGIGGMEASAALIDLLRDPNQAIALHAITWMGNGKIQRALPHLLQLVLKRDFLGKTRALKKEALLAIGRIGDRRALDQLFKLVRRRYWILPGRWDELKLLAVESVGNLGGEAAQEFLVQISAQGGHLGRVSAAALESLAKRNHDNNE